MLLLETPRLVLRHLEPTDLDALFALYRDPEMRRYYPDGTRTRAETEEELHWHREGRPEFPELAEAARAITDHARTALHLSRLICLVTPGNDASVGVAE
jgi:ribosomal-protein-alanine N-acetyltransferase